MSSYSFTPDSPAPAAKIPVDNEIVEKVRNAIKKGRGLTATEFMDILGEKHFMKTSTGECFLKPESGFIGKLDKFERRFQEWCDPKEDDQSHMNLLVVDYVSLEVSSGQIECAIAARC